MDFRQQWALACAQVPDLRQVIRDQRMKVCEAYCISPEDALDELARASLRLTEHVVAGGLSHRAAFDPLQEVAENLGLVDRWFGQDAVQEAIAYGPRCYAALTWERAA
jgi:hypothetical protein